jgi:GT2 family glycosyltransferase
MTAPRGKSVLVRRVLNGLRYVARGDFRGLARGLAEIWEGKPSRLRRHNLVETMNCFRPKPLAVECLNVETDIIIPIYNGVQFLPKLFETIRRNTTSPYRLILVDDCSSDPGVKPILESMASESPNYILLRNDRNVGFVESVNRAARHAQNHFVLLNTDIEVPPRWLERLLAPILRDSTVASATPFTNAGTICSFPRMAQDNELPYGLNVEQVDAAFWHVDAEKFRVELPTGVGFCMAINRAAWTKIGEFDNAFGRGYGEENDWCLKAMADGFSHLLVPNLFIYHKHGGSFASPEKQSLLQRNLKIIQRRYPAYTKKVREFINNDLMGGLRDFLVMLVSQTAAGESSALVFDHRMGGGANTYRRHAVRNRLEKKQSVLLITADSQDGSPYHLDFLSPSFDGHFEFRDLETLGDLLNYISVGEVFCNNLVGWPEPMKALAAIKKARNVAGSRLTLAVHDYYVLCPSYNLINDRGVFCNLPSIAECQRCLPRNGFKENAGNVDIREWRGGWQALIDQTDQLLCFSKSSLDLVSRMYQLRPSQPLVRPHALEPNFTSKPNVRFDNGLHIGVVGGINHAKGAAIVTQMAKIIEREDTDTTLTVIGSFDGWLRGKRVKVTGPYVKLDLPSILTQCGVNICFLPSIWPETFSYVTSELLALEMPICCFDLGAPAERVRNYDKGLVISQIDAVVALDEIRRFFESLEKRFANSDTVGRQQV